MPKLWKAAAGLILSFLLAAAPAGAEWRRAESPNFVLYGNAPESQLRARILLLEDFDRLLRMLASGEQAPAPKLHVYIVSGIDDLRIIRPVPDGIAGYYIATDDGIAAFVDGRAEGRGNETLFHEYTHHFMRQHMPSAYPTWYVEGFAEYFATVRFTARRIDIGTYSQGRAYAILEGQWLPMERILSGGIDGLSQQAMSLYYAQSWLLVHYFYSTPERQAALARLLRASRLSGNAVEALQAATGLTPQGLTEELRRYIGGGQIAYRQAPRASAETPPPVTVTVMPPSASEMIIFEAALRVGILADNEQPYLQRIRTAAARFPDDPLAMRVLAHAEMRFGDGAVADRLLDRLVAAAPNDAELLYLKGMRYLLAAQGDNPPDDAAANARLWFGRARAADPNNFQTLIRYVESLRGEPGYVSDETRDLLVRASQLAPQVASIAFNTASVLIARGDYDQAMRLLAPLAVNPHDPGLANAARRLMAEAIERRMNGRGRPPQATPAPDGAPPPDKD
ncbi:MAG: hypothetical protein QOH47_1164 [Sphingomonadales bacterium]|jgi:hypothetical protein|nr:hypothetical protein [Sphingomonadales bacterium]